MKDGVVQQFGTPTEIYSRPVNTFVASFMGSPPMNLIPVTLAVNDGVMCAAFSVGVAANGTPVRVARLPLLGFNLSDLETIPATGTSVLLGLRPEHMTDAGRMQEPGSPITVPVDLAESTGADTLVFTTLGGVRCVCRLHPDAALGQDEVELAIDVTAAVLFDPDSHQAIAFAH
jgi:multiple sugar transport system ATP-binding protein